MDNLPPIGKNIQKLRASRHLTLNILSERSGVSKAMLSQIESDKVNPTVATVCKIARGLNVDLQDLLNDDLTPKRDFIMNPTMNSGHMIEMEENGVRIRILSPLNMVEDLEMYLIHFQPHTVLSSDPHFPGTQEFLTVMKGTVEVTAGNNHCTMKKDDFLMYHCDIEHTIICNSNQGALVHMVVRYNRNKE
ncbi:MAG: XRE family transcriptional regulator [Spirochaetia bacterium]|nr:XRE family transcriptional regulator [Spirochaetia bacterium]